MESQRIMIWGYKPANIYPLISINLLQKLIKVFFHENKEVWYFIEN